MTCMCVHLALSIRQVLNTALLCFAAVSPIAESPELSERDTSATPEAVSLVADSSTAQAAQREASSSIQEVTGELEELPF